MNLRTIGSIFLAGVFLAGCAAIRDAHTAQAESGDSLPPGERSATAEEMGLRSGETLTLADAIAISLKWNPAMAIATQNLASAQIALHQAGVSQRPTLSGSVGYSESYSRSEMTDGWEKQSNDAFNYGLSLSWTLVDFGQTAAARRRAAAQYAAAAEAYRNAGIQRIAQVRVAYLSLGQAENLCVISMESLDRYKLLLKQAELKLQIGTGKKYDVTKARVDCSNAALSLINASNAVLTARATLNSQLGLAQPVDYRIADLHNTKSVGLAIPSPLTAEVLLEFARTNQPALMMSQAQVRAASAAVDAAVAALYPNLSLSGSLSTSTAEPVVYSANWGASFVKSLFSGWGKRDALRQSVVALRIARANLAQQEQQMLYDITSAIAARDTAQQSLRATNALREQAWENLELVLKQFDLGTSSILDRSDAQLAYTQANINRGNAVYGHEIAIVKLNAILGLYE